jgi:hypothetical protein
MLEAPLVTPRSINDYIARSYGYPRNSKEFLSARSFLRPITLDHSHQAIPRVLYQDSQRNSGDPSAWDVALSLHPESYVTGQAALQLFGLRKSREDRIDVNWVRGKKNEGQQGDPIDVEALTRISHTFI